MQKISKQLIFSAILLGSSLTVSSILYLIRPSTELSQPVYNPITVDVAIAEKETVRIPIQAQGNVSPVHQTQLQAEVRGRIVELANNFEVGGFIKRNEVILRIDPRDYETNIIKAQAAVESAESILIQEKGRSKVAREEWLKIPKGSQRSKEASDLYLRKPQLELAQAQLRAAQADLKTARDNLDRTIMRAPYDSLVKARLADIGQFVSPGINVAELVSIEVAKIRLPIPQGKLSYINLPKIGGEDGEIIDLYTDTNGEIRHWTATLNRTEGVFDERSRTLFAVAYIEDPYALKLETNNPLRIGTFVNANILGKAIENLVVLPRYILRTGNEVLIVDKNNKLRSRKVTLLRTGGDLVFVSNGINEGEKISLTTLGGEIVGAEVKIVSEIKTTELHENGIPPKQPSEAFDEPISDKKDRVLAGIRD